MLQEVLTEGSPEWLTGRLGEAKAWGMERYIAIKSRVHVVRRQPQEGGAGKTCIDMMAATTWNGDIDLRYVWVECSRGVTEWTKTAPRKQGPDLRWAGLSGRATSGAAERECNGAVPMA